MVSPIQGFYERPNIAAGAVSSATSCNFPAWARCAIAWLLAVGKLTVVAFFTVFLVFITRAENPQDGRLRRGA